MNVFGLMQLCETAGTVGGYGDYFDIEQRVRHGELRSPSELVGFVETALGAAIGPADGVASGIAFRAARHGVIGEIPEVCAALSSERVPLEIASPASRWVNASGSFPAPGVGPNASTNSLTRWRGAATSTTPSPSAPSSARPPAAKSVPSLPICLTPPRPSSTLPSAQSLWTTLRGSKCSPAFNPPLPNSQPPTPTKALTTSALPAGSPSDVKSV